MKHSLDRLRGEYASYVTREPLGQRYRRYQEGHNVLWPSWRLWCWRCWWICGLIGWFSRRIMRRISGLMRWLLGRIIGWIWGLTRWLSGKLIRWTSGLMRWLSGRIIGCIWRLTRWLSGRVIRWICWRHMLLSNVHFCTENSKAMSVGCDLWRDSRAFD